MKAISIATVFFISTITFVTPTAFAEGADPFGIKVCDDKTEGDVCDFMDKAGNSVNGFCRKGGDGKGLICVPSN